MMRRNDYIRRHCISLLRAAICIAAVIAAPAVSPALTQSLPPCTMEIDPIWSDGPKLIKQLQNDAFGPAFSVYIRDLKGNQTKLEEWQRQAEQFFREQCRPVQQEFEHHEEVRRGHDERCAGAPPDVWNRRNCQQTFDWLLASKARLDPKLAAVGARGAEINQSGAALLAAEQHAIERARIVIDPKNSEDAFRLFVGLREREVRSGSRTSCQAMAELYDALARRLDYDGITFCAVLERTFALRANPLLRTRFPVFDDSNRSDFIFSGSGFKQEFFRGATRDHVRHFTFYFVQGVRMGLTIPMVASFYEDYLSNQPEDFRLTLAAISLADTLGRSPHGIGNAIRRNICQ